MCIRDSYYTDPLNYGYRAILGYKYNTIKADDAPIVEIDLRYEDKGGTVLDPSVADVYFIWKTSEGGETWFEAAQSEWCTNPKEQAKKFSSKMYFTMYLHPDYAGKTITAAGVRIIPKTGTALKLDVDLNYFYFAYDARQSNFTTQYLIALNEYVKMTNDTETLAKAMPKARRGMQWLLTTLRGENGLLDVSWLYGHDGRGNIVSHGIANGYWDMLATPAVDLETNIHFYQALTAMSEMEEMLQLSGAPVDEISEVCVRMSADTGRRTAVYEETAASLNTLAGKVKTNIQKNVENGGFWDSAKERFVAGKTPDNTVMDFGFVMWNLEALACGIATPQQKAAVMSWIDGTRIVTGDTSTGNDIYKYEFAPRTTTLNNVSQYLWSYKDPGFGKSVPNGGSVLAWSYYDLLSRIDVNGADDSYARLSQICDWYEKVKAAGGTGSNFYQAYYNGKGIEYVVQGDGTTGSLGLDSEFLESCMLYSSVPYGFFGMNAGYGTLSFTNQLPSELSFWRIQNLLFAGRNYNVEMTKDSFTLSGITGGTGGLTVSFTFLSGNTVMVNGKVTENGVTRNADGSVTVTVPFENAVVCCR